MRILLVDPEPEQTGLVLKSARPPAYPLEIEVARTVAEAFALLERVEFDAVLAEHRLGRGVSGVDVLALALLKQPKALRALLASFHDPAVERGAQVRARVDACLEKGLSAADFTAELRRHVFEPLAARARPRART